MLSVLITFSVSHLFSFQYQRIVSGDMIFRHVDTLAGQIFVNLSILNSPPNYSIQIYAYEEARKPYVFQNISNFQPICCPDASKCMVGHVFFADKAPVISRTITSANTTNNTQNDDIVLYQNNDIEIPRKGIWTILISNCGSEEIMINGYAQLRRHDGCLDIRLKHLYTISILISITGIGMISYNIFMWISSVPKLTLEQKISIGLLTIYAIYGISTAFLYRSWNQTGEYKMILSYISCFIRASLTVCVYYSTLHLLQLPDEFKLYYFFAAVIPVFIGSLIEFDGIRKFSSKDSGQWKFGYGNPCLEFILLMIMHIFVYVYAHIHTPKEDANEKRRFFLAIVLCTAISYIIMNFSLFVFRIGKTIIQTRKSEWVPFTLWPMLIAMMMSVNAWYAGELNPEGWQMFNETEEAMKSLNYKRRQTKFAKKQVKKEEIPVHGPKKLQPVELEEPKE